MHVVCCSGEGLLQRCFSWRRAEKLEGGLCVNRQLAGTMLQRPRFEGTHTLGLRKIQATAKCKRRLRRTQFMFSPQHFFCFLPEPHWHGALGRSLIASFFLLILKPECSASFFMFASCFRSNSFRSCSDTTAASENDHQGTNLAWGSPVVGNPFWSRTTCSVIREPEPGRGGRGQEAPERTRTPGTHGSGSSTVCALR